MRSLPQASLRRVLTALLAVMVVGLVACGDDSSTDAGAADPDTTTTTDTTTTETTTADTTTTETTTTTTTVELDEPDPEDPSEPVDDEYCVLALETQRSVEREFVGSEEHVAEFDALLAVAPDEIADDIALMREHFATSVDPSDPSSQDFVNFPSAVQDAATRVQEHITATC